MSLSRTSRNIFSATPLLRSIFASRPCPNCSFAFKYKRRPLRHYSKRSLQTATAYRPSRLDDSTFPPRNAGVPDTSIAGVIPSVDDSIPPPPNQLQQRTSNTDKTPSDLDQAFTSDVSLSEGEAQKSKPYPIAAPHTTPPSQTQPPPEITVSTEETPAPPKRSRLRARRAAITLSQSAVTQLRELIDQPDPKLIRIGVKNRGCSGLAYNLEYVDKAGTFDEAVEQDGVKVLVDSKALFSIIGSEMDWVEDKLSRRFVFRNPNITEQCGCGESFSVI